MSNGSNQEKNCNKNSLGSQTTFVLSGISRYHSGGRYRVSGIRKWSRFLIRGKIWQKWVLETKDYDFIYIISDIAIVLIKVSWGYRFPLNFYNSCFQCYQNTLDSVINIEHHPWLIFTSRWLSNSMLSEPFGEPISCLVLPSSNTPTKKLPPPDVNFQISRKSFRLSLNRWDSSQETKQEFGERVQGV